MLSRLFWIGLAGLALLIGMFLQDGRHIFSWVDDRADISARTERAIDASIDKAVDKSVNHLEITGPDGEEINADPAVKRALAVAVGELVKAEADLAVLHAQGARPDAMGAARTRRDGARAEVDRLKAQIKGEDVQAQVADEAAIRAQVRDDVRDAIRDAAGN
jgi:hypothetical protein